MYKELEEDIWEAVLKAAVVENSFDEMAGYPSQEKLNKLKLPENYQTNIYRFIKYYRYREGMKWILKYGRKIASILIVIMGISFAGLLSFKEVRAACQRVIIHVFEKYLQFDFYPDKPETISGISFNYVPYGYYLFDSTESEYKMRMEYKNDLEETIELTVYFYNSTAYIDNEHYIVKNVQINEREGTFFESTDINFGNYVVWHTDEEYFSLSASALSEEVMLKIAENIK